MKKFRAVTLWALTAFTAGALLYSGRATAQTGKMTMPPNRMAHVLVVAQTKGFEHDSFPNAMATIWQHGTRLQAVGSHAADRYRELITKNDPKGAQYEDAELFRRAGFCEHDRRDWT